MIFPAGARNIRKATVKTNEETPLKERCHERDYTQNFSFKMAVKTKKYYCVLTSGSIQFFLVFHFTVAFHAYFRLG